MTACERSLPTAVKATTSMTESSSKANARAARAASVARPRPQCERAIRHPISIAGVKAASKGTGARPLKPSRRPLERSSTAHSPHPRSSSSAAIRRRSASLSSRSSMPGKWRITSGSVFMRAKASASPGRQ